MKYTITIFLIMLIACFTACDDDSDSNATPVTATIQITDSLFVEEGNTGSKNIVLRVGITEVISDSATIFISTKSLTENNNDYTELDSNPIFVEPGDLRIDFAIEIFGDKEFEEDEVIEVTYKSSSNLLTDETHKTFIIIENDDLNTALFIPDKGYTSPTSYEGYDLIWADEFNGSELDENNWTHEIGGGGWGNNELQYYTDKNTYMAEGNLVIEARKEFVGGRAYTSSRIVTQDKFEFQYGRVDIRAALPFGQGIWPAQWMLGANFPEIGWPRCGEIDIMELIGGGEGRDNVVHGTVHWQDDGFKADFGGAIRLNEGIFYDEYHVFSITWTPNKITWFMDDIQYHEMDITGEFLSEFRAPYFFIFNVAVGGNWPGSPNSDTVFPQRMIVDYIRVFQLSQ